MCRFFESPKIYLIYVSLDVCLCSIILVVFCLYNSFIIFIGLFLHEKCKFFRVTIIGERIVVFVTSGLQLTYFISFMIPFFSRFKNLDRYDRSSLLVVFGSP